MCDTCENPQICKYGKCQKCYFTKRRWCLDNNKCFFCETQLRQFKTKIYFSKINVIEKQNILEISK